MSDKVELREHTLRLILDIIHHADIRCKPILITWIGGLGTRFSVVGDMILYSVGTV